MTVPLPPPGPQVLFVSRTDNARIYFCSEFGDFSLPVSPRLSAFGLVEGDFVKAEIAYPYAEDPNEIYVMIHGRD